MTDAAPRGDHGDRIGPVLMDRGARPQQTGSLVDLRVRVVSREG